MEIQDAIKNIPPFTRYYMGLVLANTVLVSLNIVSGYSMMMDFELFFTRLNLWRIFTWFTFYGKFSFNLIMILFLSYFWLSSLEKHFGKNIHDFYYMICFLALLNLLVGYILGNHYLLIHEFLFSWLYVFSKREPENVVNFWGFPIKLKHFPWVLLVLQVLMGASLVSGLAAFMVGHLYIFLKFILPDEPKYRHDVLKTPRFFKNMVDWIALNVFKIDNRPARQMNNIRIVHRDSSNDTRPSSTSSRSSYSAFRCQGVRLGGE